MKIPLSVEKIWFVLSVAILSFTLGVLVEKNEWPPHSVIESAFDQAQTAWDLWVASDPGIMLFDRAYERAGVRMSRSTDVRPGMTLITSSWKDDDRWKVGLKLIHRNGAIAHEWLVDRTDLFQDQFTSRRAVQRTEIHGAHLFPNGDVLVNLGYVGLARLDACGDVVWTVKEGNHHSIAEADDGTFWVPGARPTRQVGSERYPDGFPGLGGKRVWVDRILQVSPDGVVLQDIPVLDLLYENGLARYIPKVMGGLYPSSEALEPDVTHINDVEPLSSSQADEYPLFEAGDLAVSLRSLSLVFVVDPESKRVKWHASDPFIYQHDPDFLGDGWIGVLDNNVDFTERGSMLGGSRIVALQPHTDSLHVRFPTPRSEPFYTPTAGKWEALGGGHMLLTEATAGRAVEVNSAGRTVWEWVHEPVGKSKVPAVTKASRHDVSRDQVASWSCSSVDTVDAS